MIVRAWLAVPLALLVLAFAAPAAHADATFVVNTLANIGEEEECETGSECSLREALEAAEAAEGVVRIEIDVEGTIEIEGIELELEVPEEVSEVVIAGPGREALEVDAEGESRVLSIEEPGKVAISGLTLADGTVSGAPFAGGGGGGLLVEEADLELRDVRVTGNEVSDARWGGGIEIRDEGSVTMRDSEVDHNEASGRSGGGIYVNPGTELSVVDSTIADNFAGEAGGGISTYHAAATVTGSVISGNEAEDEGGGINAAMDIHGHGTLVVEGSEVIDNKATASGGGIRTSAETELIDTKIVENESITGGGLFAEGNYLQMLRSTVALNNVHDEGFVRASGAGISLNAYVPLDLLHQPEGNVTVIEESTIAGNVGGAGADGSQGGAGIAISEDSALTLETSTIADNNGGAMAAAGEVTLRNSTVYGNSSEQGPGGIENYEGAASIQIESSILAGNTNEGAAADCSGEVESKGHNILGSEAGCEWEGSAGDQVGVDPLLAPLGDFGGPTETMPPVSRASPAINQGEDPGATDQRGLARPVPVGPANTDVGAVEVQKPILEAPPTISFGPGIRVGDELECLPGTWNTDTVTDPAFAYAWRAGSEALGTGQTLTIEAAYLGEEVVCEVTADNGVEAVAAESAPLSIVSAIPVLESSSLDFGGRTVGDGPQPSLPLKLTNEGNENLDVLAVTDGESSTFSFDPADCIAGAIAPGESCVIEVGFAPAARGTALGTLSVMTNGGQVQAALVGVGTETALTLDPIAIEFGEQRTRTAGAAETVRVENSGNTPLAIGVPVLEGVDVGEFTLDAGDCESLTLEPGESCGVAVGFSPAAIGLQQATLRVPGEAGGTVALEGIGVEPALVAKPTLLEFAPRALGAGPSGPQLVIVRNEGTAAAAISAPIVAGPGAAEFGLGDVDTCLRAPLAPGGECSLEVVFAPVAAGSFAAEVQIRAGDVGTAVALRGAATAPERSEPEPPRPEPQVPPKAEPQAEPPQAEPLARLIRSKGSFEVGATGVLRPGVSCVSPSGSSCAITISLMRAGKPLAHWSGRLAAGSGRHVPLRLAPDARRELDRSRRLPVTVVVRIDGGEPTRTRALLVAPPA
ncbi:MAG: choice-of-anchor D domain-containing protein [Actinobacteria bacterium]|nr:choice-of-anchor D domain-containing protein [Actinomycetota bacterium]